MCVAFKKNGKTVKPGQRVDVRSRNGTVVRSWVSYARQERMEYWIRQRSAVPVEIIAESFAERNRQTHELVWQNIPPGQVIQAVLAVPREIDELLFEPESECYVVTRAATAAEIEYFGHDRLPSVAPQQF